MAKAEKEVAPPEDEAPKDGEDGAASVDVPKQGFVKKLLGNKKLLIIAAAGALVVVLGAGAGTYFLFFSGSDAAKPQGPAAFIPPTPPQVAFFNVPDILVNIQTPDGSPAYLKLSVALELDSDLEKPGLQVLMPRLVDQFQSYLRELRIDDLKGSDGVMRVKEELLRRVNVAAAPYHVRDVLLKEMIVQ